jgi:hypothetical protein
MGSLEEQIRDALHVSLERSPKVARLVRGEAAADDLPDEEIPVVDDWVAALLDFAGVMRESLLTLAAEVDRLKAGHGDASSTQGS